MRFSIFKCEVCKKLVYPWDKKSTVAKAHNKCQLNKILNETLVEIKQYGGIITEKGMDALMRGIRRSLFADSQLIINKLRGEMEGK